MAMEGAKAGSAALCERRGLRIMSFLVATD